MAIPDSTIRDIQQFAKQGIDPGGFVRAVLENNLKESFLMADEYNLPAMAEIVSYCRNQIPSMCWGSPVERL